MIKVQKQNSQGDFAPNQSLHRTRNVLLSYPPLSKRECHIIGRLLLGLPLPSSGPLNRGPLSDLAARSVCRRVMVLVFSTADVQQDDLFCILFSPLESDLAVGGSGWHIEPWAQIQSLNFILGLRDLETSEFTQL